MTDARVHPRFLLHALADVIGSEVVLARPIADVSLGGCRFAGRAWEVAGQTVHLVISLPGISANLPLSGQVVRASDRDMGIKFHDLSDEQKWALRKHIREAQKQLAS